MKVKSIFLFLGIILFFASCSKDTDPVLPSYSASILSHPENGTLYELKEAQKGENLFTLSWTSSTQDELKVGPATFYVQIDLAENNFANPMQITQVPMLDNVNSYSVNVNVAELNTILTENYGLPANAAVNMQFRIITNIGNATSLIPETASNIFEAKIIPYESVATRQTLFMVGNMFGVNEWNNGSTQFPMFRSEPNGTDTYTGWFKADGGLKLIPQSYLGSWDFAYGALDGGILSSEGGDIKGFDADGYYTLTADTEGLTYSIKPYDATGKPVYEQIGLVGDFNGWGSDIMFTQTSYDPHIWSADNVQLEAGGAKFRADADWATSWGGETFPYGGASGENIPVSAGKYYILFNDLTGEYVFYAK